MSLIFANRVLFGALALAYFCGPAWLLTLWLFPDERPSWQIAVGSGMGISLLGLMALILSGLPVGITQMSIVVASIVLAQCLVLPFSLRPQRVQREVRRLIPIRQVVHRPAWKLYVSAGVGILSLSVFLVAIPIVSQRRTTGYTEFYIVEGLRGSPPWRSPMATSSPVSLTLSVVSREGKAEPFQIYLMTEGETIQVLDLGIIPPGANVQQTVTVPPRTRSEQQYAVVLYKTGADASYRTLHFWLRAPRSASPSVRK